MLSTLACRGEEQGFPRGGVVEYVLDSAGRALFSLSSLSGHTQDLLKDERCSFTVTQPDFKACVLHNHIDHLVFAQGYAGVAQWLHACCCCWPESS